MIAFRFLSGLPHGAYFGVGALVAASLVPRERRSQAVGRMLLGLTVATIVGVPLANMVGQRARLARGLPHRRRTRLLTAVLVAALRPRHPAARAQARCANSAPSSAARSG